MRQMRRARLLGGKARCERALPRAGVLGYSGLQAQASAHAQRVTHWQLASQLQRCSVALSPQQLDFSDLLDFWSVLFMAFFLALGA
jgi:hypothetical protein